MIRVKKKGKKVPNILKTLGAKKNSDHISSYKAAPAGYHLNTKARVRFDFDNKIYGHADVKKLLRKIQADKCCFCEAKVSHISPGDVEHFRPKAGFKQDKQSRITYPGYYWLAYRWSNLYFSCQLCNERNKANFFPLKNKKHRADPVTRSMTKEVPLFIDPGGGIDPETQIYFIGSVPTHVTKKGRLTINYLSLDRIELNERREEKLNILTELKDIVELTKDSANATKAERRFLKVLKKSVEPSSEYSSMFKSNFKKYLKQLK